MTKILPKNKLTTAFICLLFTVMMPTHTMAQKNILYVTKSTFVPGAGASAITNDPIIRMFNSDANFILTVTTTDAAGTGVSLTGYDLVIVQETFGSGDAALKPTGPLGIKNLTIPVIYNKTFALRNTRAVTDSDAAIVVSSALSITVDPSKQSNPLFSGISFSGGNNIKLYENTAANTGITGVSSLDVLNELDISTTGTLLASSSIPSDVTNVNKSVVVNDIPAGTQLGTAVTDKIPTGSRMIAFAFNYGPIIMGDGTNISSEALTIWRNAAYVLTGLTVPTTLYQNPALGLEENTVESDSVSVSPNPTSGIVTVNSNTEVKAITVFDVTGKQVSTSKTNTVDLSNQSSGVYLLKVQTENGSTTKKVVVE
ncbi:MAG: T9SS type A sorting domain-containing protein [Bacteroidota bacterium]